MRQWPDGGYFYFDLFSVFVEIKLPFIVYELFHMQTKDPKKTPVVQIHLQMCTFMFFQSIKLID